MFQKAALYLVVGFLLVCVSLTSAQELHSQVEVDARLRQRLALKEVALFRTTSSPNGSPIEISAESIDALVELRSPATPEILSRLRQAGVLIQTVEGQALAYGHFVAVTLDSQSFARLRRLPDVRRLRSFPSGGTRPLTSVRSHLGTDAAWATTERSELRTGEGVVIADVDSLADVFHPHFFYGDGGWYSWIDVDGDGVFTPTTDAIDLNANGEIDTAETALMIPATARSFSTGETLPHTPGFDPGVDWIYLDLNQNGGRDFAADVGFDDSEPAFGEPLFVPDDVDGDGKIGIHERFVRLGTSKFRKVYAHLDFPREIDEVYTRGENLAAIPLNFTGGPDSLHATAVLSAAAGGVPLLHRRQVGSAPNAELVLAFSFAQSHLPSVMWALGEEPDVMLHEISVWTGEPLDGSDAWSALIDESQQDGVAHVCPAGNIAGVRKHAVINISAGETASIPLTVPRDVFEVRISFHLRGGRAQGIRFQTPSTEGLQTLSASDVPVELDGGLGYIATMEQSSRGTDMIHLSVFDFDERDAVPPGTWEFEIVGDGSAATTVHAFVADSNSGFGLGAAFPERIASDANTLALPAVADGCISVGAFPNHLAEKGSWAALEGSEEAGEVRAFSSRGPRIDGTPRVDILAPDNTVVAAPFAREIPFGSFRVFGGTSGAAPHVAGVAALLAQSGVHGLEARDRIRNTAISDAKTGDVPNDEYGYGRLSASAALNADSSNLAPSVVLHAEPSFGEPGSRVVLKATATDLEDAEGELLARWDDGYDGTWETEFASEMSREVVLDNLPAFYKVRVRDSQGRVSEASIRITDTAPPMMDAGVGDGGTSASGTSGGGCSVALSRSTLLCWGWIALLFIGRRKKAR